MTIRTYKYIVCPILLIVLLQLAACERRPLEERTGELAIIPIHIDWSQSMLDVTDITNFSIWLFPKDGSPAIENQFVGSLTDIEIKAPVGSYAMIVFNETANDVKWDGFIEFRGTDKYETFGSYLCEDNSNLIKVRGNGDVYYKTAKSMAAWSIDEFVVTQNMVNVTRARTDNCADQITRAQHEAVDRMLSKVATVTPLPMVRSVHVKAKVVNLQSSKGATATFRGVAYGVILSTGVAVKTAVSHILPMNNRQYDESGKNGTIECRFMTFGLLSTEEVSINMNFLINDDTWLEDEHYFNVTEVVNESHEYEVVINIGKPDEEQPEDKDHEIILPETEIGPNVGVGEWDEELVDIK